MEHRAGRIRDGEIHSPFSDFSIPQSDIWTFLETHLKQMGDQQAIVDSQTLSGLSAKQLLEQSATVASNLLLLGFRRDRPVCILMVNSVENILLIAAVLRLGGTVSLINPLLHPREVNVNLNNLSSEILCCDKDTVKTAIAAAKHSTVKKIVIKGEHKGCVSLSSLLEGAGASTLPSVHISPSNDVGIIQFSSGTTGVPKPVMMTHTSFLCILVMLAHPELESDTPSQEAILVYQPISHIYGLALSLFSFIRKKTLVIIPRFDLDDYVSLVVKYKCEQMYFVPPIAVLFSKSNLNVKYDLSRITTIFSAAAPLAESVEETLTKKFKQAVQVRQLYGMTEGLGTATPPKSYFPNEPCPQGSVGLPWSKSTVKVIDVNTGEKLGAGKQGEICIRTVNLMKGYYGNKEATALTIDEQGWLHTGDLGHYDKNGYLYVVDRLKELIKYKGHQVAPAEIENLLLSHPEIADAGVTAVPDEVSGELPCAWVVRKPSSSVTESQIQQYVAENAAPYKKLRGGVYFVKEIPKSPSGKILRREIKRITASRKKAKL